VRPQYKVVWTTRRQLYHTRVAFDHNRSPVCVSGDVFDPRDGTTLEVRKHGSPIKWWLKSHSQCESAVGNQTVSRSPTGPKFTRRISENLPTFTVELANAAKPGCQSDFGDREVRIVEKTARKVRTARSSELVRCCTKVLEKQPAQMPARDTQAGAELSFGPSIESAIQYELNSSADELRRREVAGRLGPIWAAA
jgi:hypothetical protein